MERRVPCTSDAECIALFLKGNDHCFTELVKHHKSELLRYINSYTRNWQHSKELFQDVLMDFVLLLRSGKYVEQGKVHNLLISMAHNRINNYLRKRNSHDIFVPLTEQDDQRPEQVEEEPWQPTRSELARLHLYLGAMKERQRALFLQRYSGIPYKNIGRNLGISTAAAKVEFSRTVKKLRQLLKNK